MSILKFSISLICLIYFSYGSTLFGQTELITDRPDQTESSATVPEGSLQIESGAQLTITNIDEINYTELTAPSTLFRYGLTKGFEIRVLSELINVSNSKTEDKITGIGDLELGFKAQLYNKATSNTQIAFLSHLILPSGTEKISNGDYGSINKLSISHGINDKIAIGYNIGYDYLATGNGDLTYSLALGVAVGSKIAFYLEPYGAFVEFEDHEANFDAGFTYLVKSDLQLDFSFGTGLNHDMNYIALGASLLIEDQ